MCKTSSRLQAAQVPYHAGQDSGFTVQLGIPLLGVSKTGITIWWKLLWDRLCMEAAIQGLVVLGLQDVLP